MADEERNGEEKVVALQQVFGLTGDQAAALVEVGRKYEQDLYQAVVPMNVVVDVLIALESPEIWLNPA